MRFNGVIRAVMLGAAAVALLAAPAPNAYGQASGVVVGVCNGGACTVIPDPAVAALIVAAAVFEKNINQNLHAAAEEGGVGAQVLRGALGISARDIDRYGLLGGGNSELQKIANTLTNTYIALGQDHGGLGVTIGNWKF